jgi:hypothetical protein
MAQATRECILAIGLDHLVAVAEWDGYLRAVLADYRRLKAGDIGSRIVPSIDSIKFLRVGLLILGLTA